MWAAICGSHCFTHPDQPYQSVPSQIHTYLTSDCTQGVELLFFFTDPVLYSMASLWPLCHDTVALHHLGFEAG